MSSKTFSIPQKRFFTATTGVLFLVASFGTILGRSPQAAAVSTSGFNAGNIISDAVMSNKSTMTQAQIQSFMLSKNKCNKSVSSAGGSVIDDSATQAHWVGSKTTYQIKGGKKGTTNGTFLCLAKSSFSGQSAPQIIYQASQDYNVNPQVLLVLLEKEQGLITDLWPNSTQLAAATGYNCPDDDAGCRGSDAAFKKQIRGAANMFNSILTKKYGWTNFYPVGTNYIQYNPSASCGGSNVKIQNLATSALYNYTPYQPNAATLKAGWPSPGASCGAYGNLNFYMYFTTWFGSTQSGFSFENLIGKSGVIKNASLTVGDTEKSVSIGNKIYNFYSDTSSNTLRVAYWNGSKWSDVILDGPNSSASGSLKSSLSIGSISAFSYQGLPQIYYYEKNSKTIRHAFVKDNVWHVEALDGATSSIVGKKRDVGSTLSGISYSNTGIQLFYRNNTNSTMEHTWWDNVKHSWRTETLDGTSNSILKQSRNVGGTLTSVSYAGGGIQVFYYNSSSKSLIHTWWDNVKHSWRTETLDGTSNSILKQSRTLNTNISSVIYDGNVQLFYFEPATGELIHTWWDNVKHSWRTERMDGDTNTTLGNYINAGKRIGVATYKNKLFLAYYDDGSVFSSKPPSTWRLAYWNGSNWVQNTLEGGDDSLSGKSSSVPIGDISMTPYGSASLQIFYKDGANQLRHSWLK